MGGIRNISLDLTDTEYLFIADVARQCASEGTCASEVSEHTVLRAMIRLLQNLEVDVCNVRTEEQLLDRLRNACRETG